MGWEIWKKKADLVRERRAVKDSVGHKVKKAIQKAFMM